MDVTEVAWYNLLVKDPGTTLAKQMLFAKEPHVPGASLETADTVRLCAKRW